MQTQQYDYLRNEIDNLVKHYGNGRSSLIPILQDVKRKHSTLSDFVMRTVADALDISPAEVYGVVSFYSFLNEKYHGRFVIRLCRTISCDMANKNSVARQLENDLGIKFGESTPDGKFSLEWTNCLGMCDQGPAILINEQVFTRVTPEKVQEILAGCEKIYEDSPANAKEGGNNDHT